MAPRAQSFSTSYESESSKEDIDARIDDSLRSFMDKGNDIFKDEIVDGDKKTRKMVIDAVRSNILKRLDEENLGSREDAARMSADHQQYTGELINEIAKIQAAVIGAENKSAELENLIREEQEDTSGSVSRFFKFRGIKKKASGKALIHTVNKETIM
ncbi:MAG: hypothetical protein K5668_10190 [Lachnospiraceae bacterium]|nr:hypothetical protein [Lachnospiraceae bacterium]